MSFDRALRPYEHTWQNWNIDISITDKTSLKADREDWGVGHPLLTLAPLKTLAKHMENEASGENGTSEQRH